MVSDEIKKWIKEGKKKGYSEDQLKKLLLKQGYSSSEIKKLFVENSFDKVAIILISLIIITASIGFSLYILPGDNDSSIQIQQETQVKIENNFIEGISSCTFENEKWCFTINIGKIQSITCFNEKEECEIFKAVEEAVERGDSSFCDSLNNKEGKDDCIFEIAQKTRNKDLCEKMSTSEEKENCKFYVISSSENKSVCEQFSSPEDKERCQNYSPIY